MKQLVVALLALSIVAFAPVGGNPCRETREQVLQPMRNAASYLATHPTAENLATTGCVYLLNELRNLPAGARKLRELGTLGVDNTQSRCNTSVNSIRYVCTESQYGTPRCLPEAYAYCGQWEYSMTNQPKYELAMELSTRFEVAYDKAQQLCGLALDRDDAGAWAAAQDLLTYLAERVDTGADRLFELSCGDGG